MNASLQFRRIYTLSSLLLALLLVLGGCSVSQSSVDSRSRGETEPRATRDVLTAEQIRNYPSITSVEELIDQYFSALYISRRHHNPGASGDVYMLGSGNPLFLIDGIPAEYRGSLGLNPRDVETIELVKFGATALYGLRGSNGVILITTKKR